MKSENDFKLCLEDKLLLYCARTKVNDEMKNKIISLIHEDFNWKYLVDMASRHRLRPLLYHNLNSICPELVPEDILVELKNFFNANVRKNLLLTGELIKILGILKSNDINAISYKGPFLAYSVYRNVGLRVFNDIDILINKSDAINAKNLMLSHSYDLYSQIEVNDSAYLKLDCEYRFVNNNKTSLIEINWNFEGIFISFPLKPEFLFDDIKNFNFNGFNVQTFYQVNYFLALCIHAAKHDWSRLSFLCDINEFLGSKTNINWNEILEKSNKLCIKRILFINLLLAKDLFQLDLPNEILISMENDYLAKKISDQVKRRIFNQDISLNIFQKFILDLRKREKIKYAMKDCILGLTKPTYADFYDFPLNESLFFLYFVIRPFLLVKRYGKNLIL